MTSDKIIAVINPASTGSKTVREAGKIIELLRVYIGTRVTIRPASRKGEACVFAREAAFGGCKNVIAVGGDGSINEIANGLMSTDENAASACKPGIIAGEIGLKCRRIGARCAVRRSLHQTKEVT